MSTVPSAVCESYGDLPEGWQLERLKFFATVRNSNVDKKLSEDELPVRLCNYTDVYYNDCITSNMEFMEGTASESEIERFQLKAGQVLLTKDSESWQDIGIPALVTENMQDVVCGYHLAIIEPGPELDAGYLAWSCRADPLNDQFKLGANGVTRFGLGQYPLKNAFIAIPPLEIQRRIARFLDNKTARIDALLQEVSGLTGTAMNQVGARSLCGRLGEYRDSLITAAVTGQIEVPADEADNLPEQASGDTLAAEVT